MSENNKKKHEHYNNVSKTPPKKCIKLTIITVTPTLQNK